MFLESRWYQVDIFLAKIQQMDLHCVTVDKIYVKKEMDEVFV